jgi:hypothetical protein
LTMPHLSAVEDDASDERVIKWRLKIVAVAWRGFTRMLNKELARRRNGAFALGGRPCNGVWFRALEWTPAADQLGHPHIHIWFFGPYLPHALIEQWWRRALSRALAAPSSLESTVVDVREVRDGEGGAREVIKYLTKDIDSDGRKIAPELYAPVYEALDGSRVTQATTGFMALAVDEREAFICPHCGTVDAHVNARRKRPGEAEEPADGTPRRSRGEHSEA